MFPILFEDKACSTIRCNGLMNGAAVGREMAGSAGPRGRARRGDRCSPSIAHLGRSSSPAGREPEVVLWQWFTEL
jgi:hypothetical protein